MSDQTGSSSNQGTSGSQVVAPTRPSEITPDNVHLADFDNLKVRLLCVVKNIRRFEAISGFLSRRGWEVEVTENVRDGLKQVSTYNPDFVLVSMNTQNKNISQMPQIVMRSFKTQTIVFGESGDTKTMQLVQTTVANHRIMGAVSGPTLQRKIKQIIRQTHKPEAAEDSSEDAAAGGEDKDVWNFSGGKGGEKNVAVGGRSDFDGSAQDSDSGPSMMMFSKDQKDTHHGSRPGDGNSEASSPGQGSFNSVSGDDRGGSGSENSYSSAHIGGSKGTIGNAGSGWGGSSDSNGRPGVENSSGDGTSPSASPSASGGSSGTSGAGGPIGESAGSSTAQNVPSAADTSTAGNPDADEKANSRRNETRKYKGIITPLDRRTDLEILLTKCLEELGAETGKDLDALENIEGLSAIPVWYGKQLGFLILGGLAASELEEFSRKLQATFLNNSGKTGQIAKMTEPQVVTASGYDLESRSEPNLVFEIGVRVKDQSLVVKMIDDADVWPEVERTEMEQKAIVKMDAIAEDANLDFDVFIYLKKNKKFYKIANQGSQLSAERKTRFKENESKTYINHEDENVFVGFVSKNRILKFIRSVLSNQTKNKTAA
jgi:hypothetical protein